MNLKEIVDSYLIDNYTAIAKEQSSGIFSWKNIAQDIAQEKNIDVPDKEYVRDRYRKIKQKYNDIVINSIAKSNITQAEVLNKNIPKEKIDNLNTTINTKFKYLTGKESKEKGTKEWTFTADNIPTEEEIISHFNIDTTKWKIVNIYHKTSFGGKYSITVQTNLLKGVESVNINENFINKINKINSLVKLNPRELFNELKLNKPVASLLIPKQDAHWNKADIYGNNSIEDRFKQFTKLLLEQLEKVIKINDLEEIVYIIGSDEFNSEATGETTKGTPQQNILSYNQGFEKISEFNIEIIKLLRFYSPKVKVLLLNGNHDYNVSWHLAHLLKQIFKNNEAIEIDDTLLNTKTYSYKSNLILLNHGDVIKPKDLAAKFPILAKEQWSQHSNYYVLTGDKHHEVTHDFNGIMWYQVPQLSNAKSKWDDKMGYNTSKPELLTFLFEEDGLSNILRKQIK